MPMHYPHDHENDVIYFAQTNFRNAMRKFGIKTDDRRRHTYVIGKTGMGKTTLLENMILSDIYAGHGCCYVDPHGDTAEKLLDYIPSWRINDVVYFNPSDIHYPVGFNILEAVDDDMKYLVAAGMMGVFKKIWEDQWSSRMEYILNNTILALMDTPGTTLLSINRILSDRDYRTKIIANVKDPIVRQFWVKEFASYQDKYATEAVAPLQNKIGQFLSASIMRNIVAQAKSTINIRQIMDEEKIFIINLSKGRIGEDASRLLGGMLVTKIQMSAMERVDMAEKDRNDFYLYVDEFQNFAVESFASILSEARKYRLNLIMAHQYIAQLTEEVRDAVFGNVGTMITFRVGSPDAMFMEDEFKPRFTPEDIINLPKFQIYLKLMIDGVTSQPFSALTLAPIAHRTGSEQKVIEQTRERYAMDRVKIEEHIVEWSGFGGERDMEKEFTEALKGAKAERKKRFAHQYNCSRCNKEFGLPVELDRSRPIYCEDCMPLVQKERDEKKKSGGDKGRRNDRGGDRKDRNDRNDRREVKKTESAIPKPPRVKDGQIIQKEVSGEMGLDRLMDKTHATADVKAVSEQEHKVVQSKPEERAEKHVHRDEGVSREQTFSQVVEKRDVRPVIEPKKSVDRPTIQNETPRAGDVLQISPDVIVHESIKKPVVEKIVEQPVRPEIAQKQQVNSSAVERGDGTAKRKRRRRRRNRKNSGEGAASHASDVSRNSPSASQTNVSRPPSVSTPSSSQQISEGQIVRFD